MKIRLAILDSDERYIKALGNYLATCENTFEISTFSSTDSLMQYLEKETPEMILCATAFQIDAEKLPHNTVFAYLTDSADVDAIQSVKAIGKYQKAETVYRQLLNLYADLDTKVTRYKFGNAAARMVVFVGAAGGCGATTLAVATAKHLAMHDKKVLYLNLEKCAVVSPFFHDAGETTFSDIVYTIKSNPANLIFKLESMANKDASGVSYYAPAASAIDMVELTADDVHGILKELGRSGLYDYIIVDMEHQLNQELLAVLQLATNAVLISDGSEMANGKLTCLCKALSMLGGEQALEIQRKSLILYNRFSSRMGYEEKTDYCAVLGGIPRYESASAEDIVHEIASSTILDQLHREIAPKG